MVLLYVDNGHGFQGRVANAGAVARKEWPAEPVEVRNPARAGTRSGVEVDGVTAVVIVGLHRHLSQLYKRAGIEVCNLGVPPPAKVRVKDKIKIKAVPPPEAIATLAAEMCKQETGKLCALVRCIVDMTFLGLLEEAEEREEVLACIANRNEEVRRNGC